MKAAARDRMPRDRAGAWLARRAVLFVALFAFWLALGWPFAAGGEPRWADVAIGLVVAAAVALIARELVTERFARLLSPVRYLWALAFLGVLAFYVVRANFDVAWRVLRPSMPIRPGIVRMRTALATASARTALANAITLTPGTLTVDIGDDGCFYVHWINVETVCEREAARCILGRFEWLLGKVFE